MDFVLVLHSHLPYVLRQGRWPHGSDWLSEAALDTYLPLYEHLTALAETGVPAPVTIGFTPILANQLASEEFAREMEHFFEHRLALSREGVASLAETGDGALIPVAQYWDQRLTRLRDLFRSVDRNLVEAFRELEDRGVIEILSSAATHGYLPLLARDESIRLQLGLGRAEHRRLFGKAPRGCWLPECAYRPRGPWSSPDGSRHAENRWGIEEYLAEFGFRFFITDAHMAQAGEIIDAYPESPILAERFDLPRHRPPPEEPSEEGRSPYRAYRVMGGRPRQPVSTMVRDPRSSMQVWSRHLGYPGDEWYLEFHKIRWPHGLRLWRVTGPDVDLGGKQAYNPPRARQQADGHAEHFVHTLRGIATEATQKQRNGLIMVPFDTELFGHWWFEGVDFLASLYQRLAAQEQLTPVTGSAHLAAHPPRTGVRLSRGSWGANGDDSMWWNPDTEWTWKRMWDLEEAFWDAAPGALADPELRPVLAQATRELLIAQASDWQFIISTAVARDYGERRFQQHCSNAERLVAALGPSGDRGGAQRLAEELARQNDPFPDVLPAVAGALKGERVRV